MMPKDKRLYLLLLGIPFATLVGGMSFARGTPSKAPVPLASPLLAPPVAPLPLQTPGIFPLPSLQPVMVPTPLTTPTAPATPSTRPSAATLPTPVGNWLKPAPGAVTNPFGNGYWYFGVYRGGHTGIDIKAPTGTPVKAPTAGKVVYIHRLANMRYGFYVVIAHAQGYYTLHAHLSRIQVRLGQQLQQGDVIGAVGTSGAAGYPHLHFEVLNQIPQRDGAWGYSYICPQRPGVEGLRTYNFVGRSVQTMDHIVRIRNQRCTHVPLRQTLKYYNPEQFYPDPERQSWEPENQPANEERKYQRTQAKPAAR
jgi:murein DD-endopeptidase MepM/ murein hydrolase activator NlpD